MRLLFLGLLLTSCASGFHEARNPWPRRSNRAVFLFLVDGLGARTLQAALAKGATPRLSRFFLKGQTRFAVAQASFPTQTYPNLASVLSAKPVGEQPILANHVLLPNGKARNYEDAKNHPALRALVDTQSVIARLDGEGRESASFSYILGMNAASHMGVGLQEGLEYQRHDYLALDERLISSLEGFLDRRGSSENWPDFTYMHLIGVDSVAHRYGATAPETVEYLAWLDSRLGPLLDRLERGEAGGRQVVSLLTADHGFMNTSRYVSLKKRLVKADLGLVIHNEARFLSLHLPAGEDPAELGKALARARSSKGVALTAWRLGDRLEIASAKERFQFRLGPSACGHPVSLSLNGAPFACAHDFDERSGNFPFLVSQLSRFLSAAGHPDAVVIAENGVTFAKGARANHGGPTADEVFVPLLMRNAALAGDGPVPTHALLRLLDQALPNIENMKKKPAVRQARAQ